MAPDVDELEHRGFEFLKREQWSDARHCFQEMRQHGLTAKREVTVLANIMLTFEREGRSEEAIGAARQALRLLEVNGSDKTFEGTKLAGQLKGHIAHLSGVPDATIKREVGQKLLPLAVAYCFGAMLGAYFGSSQGWRNGGALFGAVGGFFLLSRWFSTHLGRSLGLGVVGCMSSLAALYKLLVLDGGSVAVFCTIAALPIVFVVVAFGRRSRAPR